jgi:hypothetical protein
MRSEAPSLEARVCMHICRRWSCHIPTSKPARVRLRASGRHHSDVASRLTHVCGTCTCACYMYTVVCVFLLCTALHVCLCMCSCHHNCHVHAICASMCIGVHMHIVSLAKASCPCHDLTVMSPPVCTCDVYTHVYEYMCMYVSNACICVCLHFQLKPFFGIHMIHERHAHVYVYVCVYVMRAHVNTLSAWESMGFEPKTCGVKDKGHNHLASMTGFVRATGLVRCLVIGKPQRALCIPEYDPETRACA